VNPITGDIPLFPQEAGSFSWQVDAIYWALIGISAFMTIGLFVVITFFLIRYRATSNANRVMKRLNPTPLEITWTTIPMVIFTGLFVWGGVVYVHENRPPANATRIYIVGQQWYWDVRHENGRHEIGDLHVPVGEPVQLVMTSADVIHDYYIPNFREKYDVVPGKYTSLWFTATRPGQYPVLCSQYCGTSHSQMTGYLYAMRPDAYQRWLQAKSGSGIESMAQTGERLFRSLSCSGCHGENSGVHAPSLAGIYGESVALEGGQFATADEQYLRDSILKPSAKIVAGYKPIMPSYQGQISEEQVMELIAYIKNLSEPPAPTATLPVPTTSTP
jgi:cytochrome c oxidase subunit 2